jgi:hypothetical protein
MQMVWLILMREVFTGFKATVGKAVNLVATVRTTMGQVSI